ncbi:MAG: hypothetical protein ABIG96_03535 [Candidatus Micrarchaeota archaeon]
MPETTAKELGKFISEMHLGNIPKEAEPIIAEKKIDRGLLVAALAFSKGYGKMATVAIAHHPEKGATAVVWQRPVNLFINGSDLVNLVLSFASQLAKKNQVNMAVEHDLEGRRTTFLIKK